MFCIALPSPGSGCQHGTFGLADHVSMISLSFIFCLKTAVRFYDFDYVVEIYFARQIYILICVFGTSIDDDVINNFICRT